MPHMDNTDEGKVERMNQDFAGFLCNRHIEKCETPV